MTATASGDSIEQERKRAEEALRESEERFRAAFEQSIVGIVLTDLDGRVQRANAAFCELVGRPPEELLGRDSRSYTHPEDVTRNVDIIGRLKAQGTTSNVYEKRYVRKDGTIVHVQVSISSVRDAAGTPVRLIALVEDITARKRADEALARLSEQRRLALDAAQMGWWHYDLATGDVIWDERAKAIFGIARDRTGYGEVLALIHPDDRAAVDAAVKAGINPADPKPYATEFRVVHLDGAVRWVQVRGRAYFEGVGEGRRPASFVGTAADITDAKAEKTAEEAVRRGREQMELVVKGANVGVWYCPLPFGRLIWDDKVKEHFHLPPDAEVTIDTFYERIYPDDRERTRVAIETSIQDRQPYDVDYRTVSADGQCTKWIRAIGRAFYGADGAPMRFDGITVDVTDRVNAELALRESEQRLRAVLESEHAARVEAERASRLKDEFLATVSHELRTPLNAILGYSQLIRRGVMGPNELADGLAVIERNARIQAQIIEDILDMSRIASGKLRLDVHRVDLPVVLDAALATVRPAADAKGIRLWTTVDPLAGPVSGDPNRLQQVIWNLLTNAIKFTPKGGRVHVALERVNAHVEVAVSDNGQGIKPDFLPHVFDKFRQADASTTRRHGGLGLGLSIVKNLVEMHGGNVRAKSAGEGQGATFIVSLPLSAVHADADPSRGDRAHPRSPSQGDLSADRPSLDSITALVVDDEGDARELVRRLLEDCGAEVATASSSQEALDVLDRRRVDVMVSDIGMPGEDGYELVRRVRARGPERQGSIPAAALTAFARSEDRTRALRAGYQTHIAKPVEPLELVFAVASLVGKTSPS